MRGNDPARTGIIAQLLQGCAVAGREPHRVPAPALANGCNDISALRKGMGYVPDDGRRDPRHIGKRDDPAPGCGACAHAAVV